MTIWKRYFLLFSLFLLAACTEAPLSHEIKGKVLKSSVNNGKRKTNVTSNLKKDTTKRRIPPEKITPIYFGPEPEPEPFPYYVDPPFYDPILEPIVVKKDTIYEFAAFMPEFPGGQQAFINYLTSNLIYPEIAKEIGMEGKVIVSFVVFEDGTIHEATILRGIKGDGSCDKEALRLINQMPKWIPGKREGGELVKVRVKIPVMFKLN